MNSTQRLLLIILTLAGLGLLLSGYLSYWNYFGPGCSVGPLSWLVTCGGPKAVTIFGQPTCIYGFTMFLAVFITALVGLSKSAGKKLMATLTILGIAGTAFSGFLSVYEIFFLKIDLTALPACVYGLVFYVGILVASIIGWRTPAADPPIPAI